MKLFTAVAVTALGLVFGANAFAQTSPSGLTHADVMAQLHEAQAEGLLPTRKNDYPPSATEVARNRELYAIEHRTDNAAAVRTAQVPAANAESASN